MKTLLTVVAVALLIAAPCRAQSLGEIAKKAEADKAAREKDGTVAPKKLTDKDLKADPTAPATPPAPIAAASTEPAVAAPATVVVIPGAPVKDETYWHERTRNLHVQLDTDIATGEAVRQRVAEYDAAVERTRHQIDGEWYVDRTLQEAALKAQDELSRATATVAGDRIAIAAMEEEARRLGVLPGWLRWP